MKVFLGGSRHLQKVPQELVALLNEWNDSHNEFLVGDASGADLAFQVELDKMNCSNVTIYSSAGYVRNNRGNWTAKHIESGLESSTNAKHAFKDRYMTEFADTGLMLWDCESAGTLSNVIDLIQKGKSCKIWLALEAELFTFDNSSSLDNLLNSYPTVAAEAQRRLRTFRRREEKRKYKDIPDLFS
jgi:hypothetical protein